MLYNNNYKEYSELVDSEYIKENFRELNYLFTTLDKLREQYPDRDISVDELQSFFNALYPEAKADLYDGLFSSLRSIDISEQVGSSILLQIKRRKALIKLSEKAYAASQGLGGTSEVLDLVVQLTGEGETDSPDTETFVTTDLESLVNNVVTTSGMRWRLNCLNKSLGSLRKGDFGFIFARPESGKTTFLASEASFMVDQTDSPVLWINNEEQGEKVMMRFYQAYFGVKLETLLGNVAHYKKLFQETVGNKLILLDDANIDRSRIERIVSRVKPGLIIYDQIDKIKGFKADRDDLVYGEIYQWGRELAKSYAPSIGVCQAGGTAEGQKWLTMDHVANAKTSKQAEADWILGLGKTHDEASEYVRYLNISKNKLFGDTDSLPTLKHGRFEVLIQPELARYKDIVSYE